MNSKVDRVCLIAGALIVAIVCQFLPDTAMGVPTSKIAVILMAIVIVPTSMSFVRQERLTGAIALIFLWIVTIAAHFLTGGILLWGITAFAVLATILPVILSWVDRNSETKIIAERKT